MTPDWVELGRAGELAEVALRLMVERSDIERWQSSGSKAQAQASCGALGAV